MNILYIPLDERPCNALYPKYICDSNDDITLITPPKKLLSNKKSSANTDRLWEFVYENLMHCDCAVLSLEMLCYGGLLPSRLHYLKEEDKYRCIDRFKALKEKRPELKLYVFQLIMRTPNYNSSDEEPDYYGVYGASIFRRAWLYDKEKRDSLNNEEKHEWMKLSQSIPFDVIQDYEKRREYNLDMNCKVISLVRDGILNLLSIPQDDSAIYGYTAMDQKKVTTMVEQYGVQRKVLTYPGADEVGCALIARAYLDYNNKKLKVFPIFSSTNGPFIVPLYEDRIMMETLKSHLSVTGCKLCIDPHDADFILAINSPGKVMQEASAQDTKDITYTSYRNLISFVETIEDFISSSKKVVICDSAFANGGDIEFLRLLDDYEVLDKILSYKGWNTNANSLGTSLAQGIIGFHGEKSAIQKNIMYHILEDGIYQSIVRKHITSSLNEDLTYFNLKDKAPHICKCIEKEMLKEFTSVIKKSFKDMRIKEAVITSPWNRLFEIQFDLSVCENG